MKHILRCRFCGKKVGEIDIPKGKTFDPAMFADIRCSDCEKKYGNYHDIVLETEQKLKGLVDDKELPAKVKEYIKNGHYKKKETLQLVDSFVKQKIAKRKELTKK